MPTTVSASRRRQRVDRGADVGEGVGGAGAAAVLDRPGRPARRDQARHQRRGVLDAVLRLPEAAVHQHRDASRVAGREGQLAVLGRVVAVRDRAGWHCLGFSTDGSSWSAQRSGREPAERGQDSRVRRRTRWFAANPRTDGPGVPPSGRRHFRALQRPGSAESPVHRGFRHRSAQRRRQRRGPGGPQLVERDLELARRRRARRRR